MLLLLIYYVTSDSKYNRRNDQATGLDKQEPSSSKQIQETLATHDSNENDLMSIPSSNELNQCSGLKNREEELSISDTREKSNEILDVVENDSMSVTTSNKIKQSEQSSSHSRKREYSVVSLTSNERRVSCHRCGNIRKKRIYCTKPDVSFYLKRL